MVSFFAFLKVGRTLAYPYSRLHQSSCQLAEKACCLSGSNKCAGSRSEAGG